MTGEDLQDRFGFHPAGTESARRAHSSVRAACLVAARSLNELLPEGREKSLAITNLEQAMFWGNAAVARPGLPATGTDRTFYGPRS